MGRPSVCLETNVGDRLQAAWNLVLILKERFVCRTPAQAPASAAEAGTEKLHTGGVRRLAPVADGYISVVRSWTWFRPDIHNGRIDPIGL